MPVGAPPLPPAMLARPVAHRGLHDAASGVVENSRAAIRAAAAAGYGVELDVRLSADGEAIVFHDATLERLTTGAGPLAALSTSEIAALRLRDAAAPEAPPRLAQILTDIAGAAPLFIEIKDLSGALGPIDGRLEARVADLLRAYRGPVAVMSFHPDSVARLRALAPHTPRGLVAWRHADIADPKRRAELADLAAFDALEASFVSYHWADLPRPSVAGLRAIGAPVLVWTIRAPADAEAAAAHADQITFEGYRP